MKLSVLLFGLPVVRGLLIPVLSMLAIPASALPISEDDRVVVDGITWAQPALFSYLSWTSVDAQCPAGACGIGSTLKGFDMEGWTWADSGQVAALLNGYLADTGVAGVDLLDPDMAYDEYVVYPQIAPWVSAVAADFHRTGYDHTGGYYLSAWASGRVGQVYSITATWGPAPPPVLDVWYSRAVGSVFSDPTASISGGAWFFCQYNCPAATPVSAPATLPTFLMAIALMWLRARSRRSRLPVEEIPCLPGVCQPPGEGTRSDAQHVGSVASR